MTNTRNCNQMEIVNTLFEEAKKAQEERKLEAMIYHSLMESFKQKLRELPPPPPGYYYFPEFNHAELKNGEYIITSDIILKPIIPVEE